MGRALGPRLAPSEEAGVAMLDLLSYAARVDGPLTPAEAAALEAAAAGLGLRGRARWLESLPLEGGHLLPPPLDGLSYLERRVAFAAAAWLTRADGDESFVERALLDFVAEEAGLEGAEACALRAGAHRVRQAYGDVVSPAVEFDLLVHDVLSLYAPAPVAVPAPRAAGAGADGAQGVRPPGAAPPAPAEAPPPALAFARNVR
jgi:hypothetical protein